MPTLSYYDPRHNDTYVVELDESGELISIRRYVVGIGRDPIVYGKLDEVPAVAKANIEEKISNANIPPNNPI